ncbi:DUF349 domain-containing protein [Dokdonella sp.]|uniref:DUF349 domain-containing protein n=1 Tax=Dokdonella sp. TaxID=2291710 RepID=UPI003C33F5AA
MSLARFFSKPRWQSKDESVRRDAVATDKHPELIDSLPRLVREDTDPGVRIAALKRLADPGLAQAMATDDRDEGVRKTARNLWIELLAGTHAAAPSLVDRIRLLRAQDDQRLIEQIATTAPEADLRLAALQRVDKAALILDRVTADPDAAVRLAALERVGEEAQLARIVERTRKTDKTISRLANERLETLRVERGDPATIEARARQLCEQMERVLREGDGSDEATRIAATWQRIADKATPQLVTRYENARELYDLSRDPDQIAKLRQRALDRQHIESELAAIEQGLGSASARTDCEALQQRFGTLAELHSAYANDNDEASAAVSVRFTRLGARLAALQSMPETIESEAMAIAQAEARLDQEAANAARSEHLAATRAEQASRQKEATEALHAAIVATSEAIQAGKSAEAHQCHAKVSRLRRQMKVVPAALRDSLADIESEYAKIAEWQRWSDNERRQQLCEELEVLPETGLHPDALATRVREIQAEWAHMDQIEARPARAADGIARRFRALCQKAIEPAKPYFEKRDELRKQGTGETAALIAEVRAAVAAEEIDSRALADLRKQAADALRSLDRVGPRERKNLAAELKAVLTAIDGRVDAQHALVETAKTDLIARAVALSEVSDLRTAMSQARDLQKVWQKSGNGRRSRDQAQWKQFRAALDAVFARADSERDARAAEEKQVLESAAALCAELEALAAAGSIPERSDVQRIENDWRALGIRDAALRQRFESARDSLARIGARHARQQRRAEFDIWLAHYSLCRNLERGEIESSVFESSRSALAPLTLAAVELDSRIEPVVAGDEVSDSDVDALRDCVLEIEQLAGIEPPSEDRQRRMDLQVEKLSARMRGVQAPAPGNALRDLIATWSSLGPISDEDSVLESRFKHALLASLETLD